jgi:16S rRNA (cytosine967-C5)-methyltransferase
MARIRKESDPLPEGTESLNHWDAPFLLIHDSQLLPSIAASENYYIQNATPTLLFKALAENAKPTKNILDLCACPGGKLLLAHDTFPEASLYANDLTERKIRTLKENIEKYHLDVKTECGPGESYPAGRLFDLIIVDAPCSNSGVLNKRPEARWRLTPENTKQLAHIQKALLRHALTLLNDGGEVWYMTCSILNDENERLIKAVCEECNAEMRMMKTILPDAKGLDGGFAAAIKKL